ncbi:response regulator transcription factor [Streptomyces sp. LS1784]|uniref:response regulator n=1 Tax=Streptomyces sp. LS1784 TaxID=2851533 RepID=UPI001CCF22A2|nr:response regulator transcription factor [Streptomyces sp. LS1784]
MIRVLLADDQDLVRAGIRLVLGCADDIDVVAQARNGDDAIRLVTRVPVDVALLDIRMPEADGLSAAERIAELAPAVKVVMLTTFGEEENIARALRAGAAGFLLKDSPPEELIQAIRTVVRGDPVVSPRVTRHLIDRYLAASASRNEPAADHPGPGRFSSLTAREHDVFVLLGTGASNADIGVSLQLGAGTVKTHVSSVLAKLGCANRVQAAILAHDAGLLGGV